MIMKAAETYVRLREYSPSELQRLREKLDLSRAIEQGKNVAPGIFDSIRINS